MPRKLYATRMNYTYDQLSRLTSVTAKEGQEISYAYDPAGNRISVIVKGEAARSSPQEPSPTLTEGLSSEKQGQTRPPAKTPHRPPPPEKL